MRKPIGGIHRLGDSWPGAAGHKGHVITAIEVWPPRIADNIFSSGRVRCTCGEEWDTAIWPQPDLAIHAPTLERAAR